MNIFAPFPLLPPEIRHYIWHIALTSDWLSSRLERISKKIKLVGTPDRKSISQANHEAYQIMHRTHTVIDGLGWFDFSRHLLFVRDTQADRSLLLQAAEQYDLLMHIRHIVLNASNQPMLLDTVAFLIKHCPKLQSLVLVGPWFVPSDTDQYDPDTDWISPYEDWSWVFIKAPTEINLRPLFEDLEHGGSENSASIARYRSRLDKAIQRLPTPLPSHLRMIDNPHWRTRHTLDRVQYWIERPSSPPRLYLRTVEDICYPTAQNHDSVRAL
ncbi:hypothetical protein ASPWEDRAFT_187532 [Aspergillus wentii DTO 134E9]|uniref:2EXR domain-containing protein n=1 Tax=Aspergillus wentii DTO 134E9 TaxID=1073089 RepID=A0A1L9R590_ASPWE|nr:uncharacterized protein ASPWEDRAFT_187532 [Aspergillus wentii DTO 134E9]KAI9923711.1 hypothetical protein MW887_008338 [Aspergillus wentii]OJJ30064.1 hypothetical protein ASPWEDRAFT_187532 [Aspergillus wentii DTO 134E9]